MKQNSITGTCNCGAVNFKVSNNIRRLYQCHCRLCQKQSGSTSNTSTIIKATDFEWLTGESDITHWKKASGFSSDFCQHCGSPVPNKLRNTGYYWLPMGLLDVLPEDQPPEEQPPEEQPPEDSNHPSIVAHICTNNKAPWETTLEPAKQHADMPADLEAFINSLHNS